MTLEFSKWQACGNDFIIIDDRATAWLGRESRLAEALCRQHFAVGADGMLILRKGNGPGEFQMVFVNANGLPGEMCGNGARCLAAYIRRAGLADASLRFLTPAGPVRVDIESEQRIVLDLPPAGTPHFDVTLDWQGQRWTFDAIDVGAPHAVHFLDSRTALAAVPLEPLGRYARHHAAFAPRGANIHFVACESGALYLRSYERGVEAETLGCGTGATAAALLAHRRFGLRAPVTVHTSSGETLQIGYADDHSALTLAGGAHFVARGVVTPAFLKSAGFDEDAMP